MFNPTMHKNLKTDLKISSAVLYLALCSVLVCTSSVPIQHSVADSGNFYRTVHILLDSTWTEVITSCACTQSRKGLTHRQHTVLRCLIMLQCVLGLRVLLHFPFNSSQFTVGALEKTICCTVSVSTSPSGALQDP